MLTENQDILIKIDEMIKRSLDRIKSLQDDYKDLSENIKEMKPYFQKD